MKKTLALLALLVFVCSSAFAWTSDTGSGVVSANESIVRTSLEATQVLQSDALANLYGVTILGGAVNYSSFDSGGVLRFNNVVSSIDVIKLNRNQFQAYLTSSGRLVRAGVSNDDVYTIETNTRIKGILSVDSIVPTSINTNQIRISGNSTITSVYSVGACSLTFNNGLLTTASC